MPLHSLRNHLIYLHSTPLMTTKALTRIIEQVPTLDVLHLPGSTLERITNCKRETIMSWKHYWQQKTIGDVLQSLSRRNITSVTWFDDEFPKRLKQIADPPFVLYYQGHPQLMSSPHTLSVVGTRKPSEYGKSQLQQLIPPVIQNQTVIISGMAKGIDAIAHKIAIGQQGKTIAVIAGGHDHIYPKENLGLAKTIAQEHLIISEYFPETTPKPWQFPARNRLISGLGDALFVVEAGERSGTLITVDCALEQGKDVYVLPGNITSPTSFGTNKLIQDGAHVVLTSDDLLSAQKSF